MSTTHELDWRWFIALFSVMFALVMSSAIALMPGARFDKSLSTLEETTLETNRLVQDLDDALTRLEESNAELEAKLLALEAPCPAPK